MNITINIPDELVDRVCEIYETYTEGKRPSQDWIESFFHDDICSVYCNVLYDDQLVDAVSSAIPDEDWAPN